MGRDIISYLNTPVTAIKGIGENYFQRMKLLGLENFKDLVFHLPHNIIDRSYSPSLSDIKDGDIITIIVEIISYEEVSQALLRKKNVKRPFVVKAYNKTGFLNITYFNGYASTIKRLLPVGQKRAISGEVKKFNNIITMNHPDYITAVDNINDIKIIEPIYPLTAGLVNNFLKKNIKIAVDNLPDIDEWLEQKIIKENNWLSFTNSIKNIHNPQKVEDILPTSTAISRLAYDELLIHQLMLQKTRQQNKENSGQKIIGDGRLRSKLLELLLFELTDAQNIVIEEILQDQYKEERMMRLLQGDVGAGKTVVALMIILNTIEAGHQAALMAPTEVLAAQHFKWIDQLSFELGIKVALLTGKTKAKARKETLYLMEKGEVDLLIGTHAIFQDNVIFNNVGLVIIDEQHRFGVKQRMSLYDKGNNVDVLLMSATPIPRTLTLSLYGDMDCSRLMGKPKNRKPIITTTKSLQKIGDMITRLDDMIAKGEKIYWICPLVEESEKIDLAAAEDRYKILHEIWPGQVGLAHGKMNASQRDDVIKKFRDSEIKLLVATTVVEVGIDVPDATIIIIEHADRFGLAQLHQLRGRVGRGEKQSYCVLLYNYPLGKNSKERLKIMTQSQDGFEIAEADLRIRGAGDIIGTKQSGLPEFKFADLNFHQNLMVMANKNAKSMLQNNDFNHKNIKLLAKIFNYDIEFDEFVV